MREQQRVEFGESILPKLIDTFYDSPYISQSSYPDTCIRLQEIFYLYKNETMDEMTDDELLEFMKEQFDTVYMIVHFCAYGNENYCDTVTKALPGFFLYYDARFEPQKNVITLDYPMLQPVGDASGIRAIEKYVAYIGLEQKFMGTFPEEYVSDILRKFHKSYEKLFCNVCSILLRHILGRMLAGTETGSLEYERLKEIVNRYSKEQLKADTADFAAELVTAAESDSLCNVVVL